MKKTNKCMKKMQRMFAAAAAAAMVTMLLAGCGRTGEEEAAKPAAEKTAIAVVVDKTDAFVKVNLNEADIKDTLVDLAVGKAYGSEAFGVIVDGTPKLLTDTYKVQKPEKAYSESKLVQKANTGSTLFLNALNEAEAACDEADTLNAIIMASDRLHEAEAGTRLVMNIYASGANTVSSMNMSANNLLSHDTQEIVEVLRTACLLPDLESVTINWYGCGEIRNQPIARKDAVALEKLWEAILTEGGCEELNFHSGVAGEKNQSGYTVSTLRTDTETDIFGGWDEEPEAVTAADKYQEFVRVSDESIGFVKGKSDIKNESGAKEALMDLCEACSRDVSVPVYLIGSTASSGTEESCLELAEARVQEAKRLLQEMGVENPIYTMPIGRSAVSSLRVDDLNGSGGLVDDLAQKNRSVFITMNKSLADEKAGEVGGVFR